MAADPVIYCLEHLSDYTQFERLCHDLLVTQGYSNLEPLGGTKDKGRDAIHVIESPHRVETVCAYSVREDWRKKLEEDCKKIRKHGHACDQVLFLCTAGFSAYERDDAKGYVRNTFGWELELFGLERLRALLTSELMARHPAIFSPPFFPQAGGLSLSHCRDHLVIDFSDAPEDVALGTWLTRRLTLAGYNAWCHVLAPIAGTSIDETVEKLIQLRAFRYLSILSNTSVHDPNLNSRRHFASRQGDSHVIPLIATDFDHGLLDSKTKSLVPIHFERGWAVGLGELLDVLESAGCPRSSSISDPVVLRSFMPSNVVISGSEVIYSNRFPIINVPEVIYRFVTERIPDKELIFKARSQWALCKVDSRRFLSFSPPPDELVEEMGLKAAGGTAWRHFDKVEGILTNHLVLELLRKMMDVELWRRGLKYCGDRKLTYFPFGLLPSERLYFTGVDNRKNFVKVAGRRKFYSPNGSSFYRYHLAPLFSPNFTSAGDLAYTVRLRVRLTDDSGIPLSTRTTVNSRRKHLCKGWWNKEWLDRMLAVIAFLADGNQLQIHQGMKEPLTVSAFPDHWTVPLRLNEDVGADELPPEINDVLMYSVDEEDEDEVGDEDE